MVGGNHSFLRPIYCCSALFCAQRKEEVNGKKFLLKTIKEQNKHATIFVRFR